MKEFDVTIVGLGPAGGTLANLLAMHDFSILILDREKSFYPLPRAVHFDDEIMRVFQTIGITKEFLKHTIINKGTKFVNSKDKVILDWPRPKKITDNGWYPSYRFHQPDLEKQLRKKLKNYEKVFIEQNSEVRKKFKGKTDKGEIIIESGSIAKASDGEMLIDVSNIQLGVRGTRLTIGVTTGGEAKVALAEDSFGNLGELSLKSEGQPDNVVNTEQVIEVNEEREISRREQTTDEKNELKNVSQTLVEVSKIDEEDLQKKLEQKLQEGKLEDANNDGIINETDIKVTKELSLIHISEPTRPY